MKIRAKAPLCNAEPAAGRKLPAVQARRAFTLIELLVVLGIIGILAAIAVPSLRNMTKSNSLIAANRQMLDDVSYARQRAIADHTTVYMVFIPPDVVNLIPPPSDPKLKAALSNLYAGQYTSYAILSTRSVGDQPGRVTPRYLTGWRTLPNGVFIAPSKFAKVPPPPGGIAPFPQDRSAFPFPVSTNFMANNKTIPYIAFDYLGRLTSGQDELIPLARGSIFYARNADGSVNASQPADVQEAPPGNSVNNINIIHIDWLTGRARIDKQEIQ